MTQTLQPQTDNVNLQSEHEDDMASPSEFAQQLREETVALAVHNQKLGVRKSLDADQRRQASQVFDADETYLTASKKIIDTKHPAMKTVTGIRGAAVKYWKGVTIPYPEKGIRLLNRNELDWFERRMQDFRSDLDEAVLELEQVYQDLKQDARERLGSLYNEADYPPTLVGEFGLTWEVKSVEPPDYLRDLNPELYERQLEYTQQRFAAAVELAEQAFTAELAEMVEHLVERLTPEPDGKRKTFKNSSIENLHEFFDRFRNLSVRSNEDLDRLVDQCHNLVDGVDPKELRDSVDLRNAVRDSLSEVSEQLAPMIVDKPRRRIDL